MGYRVELEEHDLPCKSEEDARAIVSLLAADPWMSSHLQLAFEGGSPRDEDWRVVVDRFRGDHWDEEAARKIWVAIARHLEDQATLEFQGEDFIRWRIRWERGRVFEELVKEVIWEVSEELTAPVATAATS